jgi:hypothetical protein
MWSKWQKFAVTLLEELHKERGPNRMKYKLFGFDDEVISLLEN